MNPYVHAVCHAAVGASLVAAGVALAYRERIAACLFGAAAAGFCACLHIDHHRQSDLRRRF